MIRLPKIFTDAAIWAAFVVVTSGCVHNSGGQNVVATAALIDTVNQQAGRAILLRAADSYFLTVDVQGLPSGVYAMHLHQTGRCDLPDFTTAGSHWNPAGAKHGLANSAGPHAGDLPNLTIGANGTGTASVKLAIDLKTGPSPLLDGDGAAIVIHAKPDDNMTDPSGNSGERIRCGVFVATAQ